jgi:DNA-binding beta-propeller fold protein YncE
MSKPLNIFQLILAIILLQPNLFAQSPGYKIIDRIMIGGDPKWDYLSVDTSMHRLYVSHSSEVDIIDIQKDSLIGKITDLNSVHGIAFAPEYSRGFISNGKDNSVTIFDLQTMRTIYRTNTTGDDPDAIVYDPFTRRIFTFNGHSSNATAIDAETGDVVGTIKLDGAPEFAVSDFRGRMFVNLEEENSIDVLNPQTLEVIAKWPLSPCATPTGMAIDRKHNRLFVSGRNKIMAVVDADSGKVIATFPIGAGVDACAFDPAAGLVFCSNGDGTITEVKENSPNDFTLVGSIGTLSKAKTMALDETSHHIYTPTMIDAGDGQKSFGVLVLEEK